MFAHMKSLHTSLNTAYSGCKPSTSVFHVIIHTFFPNLPFPPLTSRPCHLHLSTCRYPIIHTPTCQMPKPPQSAIPHHICHTLYTQKTTNPHCISYPSYPSYIIILSYTIDTLNVNKTPHIHLTIIRSVLSRLHADLLSSSPRFQSHMSMHSGHEPCISFPLCGMMHPGLTG